MAKLTINIQHTRTGVTWHENGRKFYNNSGSMGMVEVREGMVELKRMAYLQRILISDTLKEIAEKGPEQMCSLSHTRS